MLDAEKRRNDLCGLARLIEERNRIDRDIAALIGRPAERSHVGEFIAATVFHIRLELSASAKGMDGRFTAESPGGLAGLEGKSVNIKFYGRQDWVLDLCTEGTPPDYYLVLVGPRFRGLRNKADARPLAIDAVHLFDTESLHADRRAAGVKMGLSTSVPKPLWLASALWPTCANPALTPGDSVDTPLRLFAASHTE
jgi:hypothetical protein